MCAWICLKQHLKIAKYMYRCTSVQAMFAHIKANGKYIGTSFIFERYLLDNVRSDFIQMRYTSL